MYIHLQLENEMWARGVAKALSEESQISTSSSDAIISDDNNINENERNIRHKKKFKLFSPETSRAKINKKKLLLDINHQAVQKYSSHQLHH